jgi:hypothetical protein
VELKRKEAFIVFRKTKSVFLLALWLLLCPASLKADLIVNGGFEQGNSGFTTNYVFSPGNTSSPRSFDITANPALDGAPVSYGDHSTGSGLMMVVKGATIPNVLVWAQIIAVEPNHKYDYASYISSWSAASPARLDVRVNGTSVGTITAPSTPGVWAPFSVTWDSGSNTSAIIELRNLSTSGVGNAFALDDFSFKGPDPFAVPEPAVLAHCLTSCLALGLGAGVRGLRRRRG